jgi:murein tripeptide amidase MpaA
MRYLRYDELVAFLQERAAQHPDLCRLEVIGTSPEGRAIYAAVLTNRETGPDGEKPGYLVDANTHAGEVTGSAAVLWTIDYLLSRYGSDPEVTDLLDQRAFYAVPRLTADGSETYLTQPYWLRSATRLYPWTEERPGLLPEDVDGDGMILQMRVADPDGEWKADADDPRLMRRREPTDRGAGPYYRIFTEGLIREWDGRSVRPAPTRWGLDFNRNYPLDWYPEARQPGGGRYPLSEPEPRALADFLVRHPNIGGYVAYHTSGGVLLRPPAEGDDRKVPDADQRAFKAMGELCTRLSGYSFKSTYEAFGYEGEEAPVKGADDWAYEHLGVMSFCMELWDPHTRAGARAYGRVGVGALLKLTAEEMAEDEQKLLRWNDEALGGRGFIPWRPFDHPQLGPVEIGGWDPKWFRQNPPPELLEEEVRGPALFTLKHAAAMPRLTVEASAEPLAPGLWRLTAAVRNRGALPTYVTQAALNLKTAPPIRVTLEGALPVTGQAVREIGHLEGWGTGNEKWLDWAVRAEPGAQVTVTAFTPRAGRAAARVRLG